MLVASLRSFTYYFHTVLEICSSAIFQGKMFLVLFQGLKTTNKAYRLYIILHC